jgi:NAD(P)-dependent dehydrogenase (short-subunit alcohol dehydrogenase family)
LTKQLSPGAGTTLDRKRSEVSLRRFPAQRTAVVTGRGSHRGIGRDLVGRLSEHGWSVAGYQVDIASQQAVLQRPGHAEHGDNGATYNVNGGLIID